MSNFTSKEDAVSFIKEIRLSNLDDWQFSQKMLEIEGIITDWYETDDYDVCDECSKKWDDEDFEMEYARGYENGQNETLECIQEYVKRRLNN